MKIYYTLIILFTLLANPVNASENTFSDEQLFEKASQFNDEGKHKEAFKIYTTLANKGFSGAENNLGYMYKSGIGVKQNYEKAIELYLRSAKKGYVHAQVNLAHMYGSGKGTKTDHDKANFWLQKASEQNFPLAQYMLGGVYEQGIGVDKNLPTALMYYNKACINNYADSCFIYADLIDKQTKANK